MITAANTLMQLSTDPLLRGRVMALYMMIFMGGTPLGAPAIGWVGDTFGARWTLLLGGLLTMVGRRRGRRALPAASARFDRGIPRG